jgi:hypothetical protein
MIMPPREFSNESFAIPFSVAALGGEIANRHRPHGSRKTGTDFRERPSDGQGQFSHPSGGIVFGCGILITEAMLTVELYFF